MSVVALCAGVGLTRQGYYKGQRARQRRAVDEERVVAWVQEERCRQPRLGTRKLRALLGEAWEGQGVWIGRDRLFSLLRRRRMLIVRRKGTRRTTDSRHRLRTHSNRYKDLRVTGVHQAWLGDMTYLETREGFVYLSLLHDAHSRQIVGHALEETLTSEGPLRALEEALGQLPEGLSPMHHTDRGIQYCCGRYQERLEAHGIGVSMTQENHCYENAQAERLNGILKHEYGLGGRLPSKAYAHAAVEQAVRLYNTRRPHTALKYRTPAEAHRGQTDESHERVATSVALRAPCVATLSSPEQTTTN